MNWQFFPVLHPAWIVLIGVSLSAALLVGSRLLIQKHVPRRSVMQLAVLRVGMIVLLVLGLFQPVLSVSRTVTDSTGLLVLVDTSASMSSPAANGSRFEDVKQHLAKSPALQAAARTHELHWFTFDRHAYPTTLAALDQAAPRGEETDVAASLKSAWNYVRLLNASRDSSARPSRALIVSDGQHRSSTDVVAVAKELGLSLDVLAPTKASDPPATTAAEIVLVQAAQRVLIGSETAFQVSVRAHQPVERLTLVVEEEGQEIQRRELTEEVSNSNPKRERGGERERIQGQPSDSLAHASGYLPGQDQFVVITHRPKEAGLKRYRFQLMRGDTPVDQAYSVNVQAVDGRHEVLILEDSWRWEFKYLRRVLEDDPSFSLTALLSRGENAFVQFGEPERRVKLAGFPQSRSELDGFDTFVLGDVRPATWPRGLARHIHGAVTEGGKSLVVMAGAHLEEWVESPELTRLLPVELTRESGTPISGQVEVRLTPEGRAASWFTVTALPGSRTRESSDRSLTAEATAVTLPTLEHVYPVLRKRPAATVLLETAGQQNAYGPLVVIAEHSVGRGRVLFIGTDTLWRWQLHGPRTDDGVTLHSAFWQHAFRALAPTEPTSARRQLFLRPERTQYRVGDSVRIATEFTAEDEPVAPTFDGTVVLPNGRRLPITLQTREQASATPAAQFEPSQPGRYRVEVAARAEGQNVAVSSVVIEVSPRGDESDGTPVDVAVLERWASATGGRRIDPSLSDGWIDSHSLSAAIVVRRQAIDLFHNFTLVLLLCVLLAVDWTLRLFRGYV
jgi:hypothetical protein